MFMMFSLKIKMLIPAWIGFFVVFILKSLGRERLWYFFGGQHGHGIQPFAQGSAGATTELHWGDVVSRWQEMARLRQVGCKSGMKSRHLQMWTFSMFGWKWSLFQCVLWHTYSIQSHPGHMFGWQTPIHSICLSTKTRRSGMLQCSAKICTPDRSDRWTEFSSKLAAACSSWCQWFLSDLSIGCVGVLLLNLKTLKYCTYIYVLIFCKRWKEKNRHPQYQLLNPWSQKEPKLVALRGFDALVFGPHGRHHRNATTSILDCSMVGGQQGQNVSLRGVFCCAG